MGTLPEITCPKLSDCRVVVEAGVGSFAGYTLRLCKTHQIIIATCKNEDLANAVAELYARKVRYHHPNGKFDKAGRWYPDDDERQECCKGIRAPSRSYPYSLMTHCRTARHVAHLYRVDEAILKSVYRRYTRNKDVLKELGVTP